MSLAATEIGLELDHGVAAAIGQPTHSAHQQPTQALGQVGAAKELDRVAVFVRSLAEMHLPEISGELGLLIAATRHVAVGCDDLTPRLEICGSLRLDSRTGAPASFSANLLVEP